MKINNIKNQNFGARYLISGKKDQVLVAANRILKEKKDNADYFQFNALNQRAIVIATDEDAKVLKEKKSSFTFASDIKKILANNADSNLYNKVFNYVFGDDKGVRWIKGRSLGLASNPVFPINVDAGLNSKFVGTTTYHTEEFLDGSWKNFGSSGKLNTEGLADGTRIDYKDGIEKFFPDGSRIKYYESGEIREAQDKNGIVKYFDVPWNNSRLEAIKTPINAPDEYLITQYFYNNYGEVNFLISSDAQVGIIDPHTQRANWYSIQDVDELDVSELTKSLIKDRLQQTAFPDGTVMIANEKGEIVKKQLSNSAIITYQNGKPVHKNATIKRMEYFYGDNGEVLFEIKKFSDNPIKTANGKIIGEDKIAFEDENGRKFVFLKKGDTWLRRDFYPNGCSVTKDINGKIYDLVEEDGTIKEYFHDENKMIITRPDGSVDIFVDNKISMTIPADKMVLEGDDYYKIASSEIDSDGIKALYNKNDEFIGELYPSGMRTYYYGKRHLATDFPDGTREKYDAWGRRIVLVSKDGTIDKFNERTRKLESRTLPDNTKFEFDSDEDVIKEIMPDGVIVNYFYGRNSYGWKTLLFKAYSNGKLESDIGVIDEEKRTITITKETGLKVVYDEFGTALTTGLIENGAIEKKYPSANIVYRSPF